MTIRDAAPEEAPLPPSNRSFGMVFTGVFLIVAVLPLWRGGEPRPWALLVAGMFALLAMVMPAALAPANRLWLHVGMAMHRVVNPVVMAVLFYFAVTPFGLLMRLMRKGLIARLRPDPSLSTYWLPKEETPSRMDQQF